MNVSGFTAILFGGLLLLTVGVTTAEQPSPIMMRTTGNGSYGADEALMVAQMESDSSSSVPDDSSQVQPRGGFRDPIGPYAAPESEGQHTSSGDLQERGVPSMPIQGDQLRPAPGYLLEKGANNQMTAKRKAGGAVTNETLMTCGCTSGTGMCMVVSKDDVAICSKYPQGPLVTANANGAAVRRVREALPGDVKMECLQWRSVEETL
jgi:hypothetical protein